MRGARDDRFEARILARKVLECIWDQGAEGAAVKPHDNVRDLFAHGCVCVYARSSAGTEQEHKVVSIGWWEVAGISALSHFALLLIILVFCIFVLSVVVLGVDLLLAALGGASLVSDAMGSLVLIGDAFRDTVLLSTIFVGVVGFSFVLLSLVVRL